MNKKLALLAVPAILLAASAATADNQWGFTPYVGADAEWRHLNYQTGFGENIFRHDYPQGNIYAGLKFNDYLAIEGGYEATGRKSRVTTLGPGNIFAGNSTAGTTLQFSTTSRIKGPHANLVGFLPIWDAYRLQLIGSVGFARLQENAEFTILTANGNPAIPDPRTFKQRKSILRVGAGLQQMISDSWGVRAMVKWENTNKFKMGSNIGRSEIRHKNSFIYSRFYKSQKRAYEKHKPFFY